MYQRYKHFETRAKSSAGNPALSATDSSRSSLWSAAGQQVAFSCALDVCLEERACLAGVAIPDGRHQLGMLSLTETQILALRGQPVSQRGNL